MSLPGDALLDAGEAMKRLAEVKDSLDIEVKQNFVDPLQNLCDKDLKEIQVSEPSRGRPAGGHGDGAPGLGRRLTGPAPAPAPPQEAGRPPAGL